MCFHRLGAAWKDLSDEARKRYHDMAHREDLEHRRKYPSELRLESKQSKSLIISYGGSKFDIFA